LVEQTISEKETSLKDAENRSGADQKKIDITLPAGEAMPEDLSLNRVLEEIQGHLYFHGFRD